jgi:NADH-quinone oxidoreductase subunit C
MISLRVLIADKKNPQMPSIVSIIRGAEWIEREIWELLGVDFIGHPDLRHLLLIDDWPQGKYPLRKER